MFIQSVPHRFKQQHLAPAQALLQRMGFNSSKWPWSIPVMRNWITYSITSPMFRNTKRPSWTTLVCVSGSFPAWTRHNHPFSFLTCRWGSLCPPLWRYVLRSFPGVWARGEGCRGLPSETQKTHSSLPVLSRLRTDAAVSLLLQTRNHPQCQLCGKYVFLHVCVRPCGASES